ncbi:MAG: hypothetical protein COT74_01450 [Bdellovibrionales bacterium CG10_big_fil_rev_8_21_14_0_10_45_34]|nr:MAG: hypothetical protein COT74_01450 [Bdellovibrionales bacterium CG10_big_fil_rev_8_21_14_0_10_45_34]
MNRPFAALFITMSFGISSASANEPPSLGIVDRSPAQDTARASADKQRPVADSALRGGIPERFKSNQKAYDTSVSGMRLYLNDIRSTRPELYGVLNEEVEELEASRNRAMWIGWGLIGAGSLAALGASTVFATKETNSRGQEETKLNGTALGLGAAMLAGGATVLLVLPPGREDVYKILRKHNRLNSKEPLEWYLGMVPSQGGAGLIFGANY